MQISSITYERKINLGDYNSEGFTILITPDPGEEGIDPDEALEEARSIIRRNCQAALRKAAKGE